MTKEELVKKVAEDAEITQVAAMKAVNATTKAIEDTLKAGGSVQLIGFGGFSVSERKARNGKNPQTGETILIPAKKVAKFKPGKNLKSL